jgi:hypothetical protein
MAQHVRRTIALDSAWLGAVLTRQAAQEPEAVEPVLRPVETRPARHGALARRRAALLEMLEAHERALDGLFAVWNALAAECDLQLGNATPSERPGEPTIYF